MKYLNKTADWFKAHVYLVSVLGFAAVLQLVNITRSSIWYDEGFTSMLIGRNWEDMFRIAAGDVHPPLYYIALKLWAGLFGTSELALRGMSVLFAVAAIAMAYLFIEKVFNEMIAKVSVLFVAIGPVIIRYAQEARMYTMAAFLILSATYLLYRLLNEKRFDSRYWYLYGLLMSASLYTHYYTLFVIGMHWLYLAQLLFKKRDSKHSWASWIAAYLKRVPVMWWHAYALLTILYIPWISVAYNQFRTVQNGFWIPPVSEESVFEIFSNFFIFREGWTLDSWGATIVMGVMLLFIAMFVRVYLNNKSERQGLRLLILYFSFSPLAIYVLSLPPFQPVFHVRYFSLTVIAFYMSIGVLLMLKPFDKSKLQQAAFGGIFALAMLYGISNVYSWGENNMRGLMSYVETNRIEGEGIISIEHYTYYDVFYYAKDKEVVRIFKGPDFGSPVTHFLKGDEGRLVADLEYYYPEVTNSVWLIAQKQQELLKQVPDNWRLLDFQEDGTVAAYHYYID